MHEGHKGGPNRRVLAHRALIALSLAGMVRVGLHLMGSRRNDTFQSPISGAWHDLDYSELELANADAAPAIDSHDL